MQPKCTFAAAALLLIAIAVTPVHGNESHFGVDDWTADDIAKHLKQDVKIDVPASAIAEVGLDGSTLYAVFDLDLAGLRLNPTGSTSVKESLQQLLHRMNTNPADFWEWRAANRRLFDNWILPLSICPRALLIWMRFLTATRPSVSFLAHYPISLPSCNVLNSIHRIALHPPPTPYDTHPIFFRTHQRRN